MNSLRIAYWLRVLALAIAACFTGVNAWAAVTGTKTALVMLVSMTNAPIDCTVAEVNGLFFTNSPLNVDAYYQHSTWSNVNWSGSVIAVSIPFGTSPCNADAWADAADAQAVLQGFTPGSYTVRVYALPSAAGSCGYAFASGNRVWNFHCSDLFAYGHEVGHSIGLGHASTDNNNDGVIENEYGGNDDCMGGESYTFNAPHKIWGGWLPYKATNGGWRLATTNGTYQLGPLEVDPASNPPYTQALKIVPPSGNPYFLSYRQPLDFDQGWTATQVGKDGRSGTINDPVPPISSYAYDDGVTIHRHSGATGANTLELGSLVDNQQFIIPGTGIVIKQTTHDTNKVTIDISGLDGGIAPLGVTFFQHTQFGGAQSQVITPGNYTLSQLAAKGVPNDWASSCTIPPGLTLIMFQDENFTGTSWTNTGDIANFVSLSPNANDALTSCKVIAGAAVPPNTPANVTALPGNAQARLAWTATPGATGFRVKRGTSNGGPYPTVLNSGVSALVDSTVANGTTYYYVVAATNSSGSSADSAQVTVTPINDLAGWWKFDENTGSSTADSSGNGNTGTLVNTPTWVTPGRLGPAALQFSGASQESVTANSSTSLNSPVSAITISAWVNATDWSGNRRILQKGNSDNQYRLLAENSLLKFHLNGVDTLTATLPPTGTWVHIAATWDGSVMILYTNGVQQASQGASGTIATTADVFAIAKKNGSGVSGDYFNGSLDDVRLYNRALSSSEITAIMNTSPGFVSSPFSKPDANAGQAYASSIASNATDPNGDTITFAKVSGPTWLSVAGNGTLSGTPLSVNVGTNSFVVSVTDTGSLSNSATLLINVLPSPPINAAISLQGTNVQLSWSGGIAPYQVQTTTNLASPNWQPFGGASSATNLLFSPSNAAGFYRIIGQ